MNAHRMVGLRKGHSAVDGVVQACVPAEDRIINIILVRKVDWVHLAELLGVVACARQMHRVLHLPKVGSSLRSPSDRLSPARCARLGLAMPNVLSERSMHVERVILGRIVSLEAALDQWMP